MKAITAKRLEALERRLEDARTQAHIHIAFAPFPGVSDKYSLTVPETGERMEFNTEMEMLAWLGERDERNILARPVGGRPPRKKKNGAGILIVPPQITAGQWEAAALLDKGAWHE